VITVVESEYDAQRPLNFSGTIEESGYEHPHGFVRLKTAVKTWLEVLAPRSRMENRGQAQCTTVEVEGYTKRAGTGELRAAVSLELCFGVIHCGRLLANS
jgi:hypothetical protein